MFNPSSKILLWLLSGLYMALGVLNIVVFYPSFYGCLVGVSFLFWGLVVIPMMLRKF